MTAIRQTAETRSDSVFAESVTLQRIACRVELFASFAEEGADHFLADAVHEFVEDHSHHQYYYDSPLKNSHKKGKNGSKKGRMTGSNIT